jgi:predicted dehydrogenase/glycosyltransferase involved in cell wall biosynthesis
VHVCLLTDSSEPSGVGAHALTLAAELQERSRVSLAFPLLPGSAALEAGARALGLDVVSYDHGAAALEQVLFRSRLTVLHVHAGVAWEGHQPVLAGRRAGVPVVLRTEHLPQLITTNDQRGAHRALVRQLDKLVCVSQGVAESYVESGIPWAAIAVVPNGTQTLEAPPARLGVPADVPLVLSVGRLAPQKRFDLLVEAAAGLPGVEVRIIGEGSLDGDLRRLIEARGVADRVLLCGVRADVPSLLAGADVVAMPSDFEGLPLVALEAMSVGTPVVGTRVCGVADAVEDGVTGRLVPAGDARALEHAIREALGSESLRKAWGEAARIRHAERFTARRMGEDMGSLYEALLSRPSRRRGRRMNQARIGLIGAGLIANRHLGNLLEFPDVEVVAVADPALERARALAGRCGASAYGGHEEMLAAERLDAVYICVPPFAHGAPEHAAMDARLPFFVEKPLAADLETAEAIAERLAGLDLVTGVGYHWRYLDVYRRAHELLADNPAQLALGYWLDARPPTSWWAHRALSGGQTIEQTTHVLDLARTLVGEVRSVYAAGARVNVADADGDIDDATTATLRFETGAVGSISSTSLLNWPHRIGLHTFSPSLAIELAEFEIMVDVGQGRPVIAAQVDPFVLEDRDFVDAVHGGPSRVKVSYTEGLRTHRLACALEHSASEGQPVELTPAPVRA